MKTFFIISGVSLWSMIMDDGDRIKIVFIKKD